LQRYGINPIDSLKKQFNPAEHEAIALFHQEKHPALLSMLYPQGYRMHDKVIRYAKKVAVSNVISKNQEA